MSNKTLIYFAIFFVLAALISSLLLNSVSVAAQEADEDVSDATTSAQETDETTEELKKRIEKVVEEKRDQVKGVIEDLLENKAGFVGEVFRVSEETITVTTPEGNVVVPIAKQVQILKDDADLMLEKLEIGNWVIVLGSSENGSIIPDYILVQEDALRTPAQYVALGTLQSIDRQEVVITVRGTGEEKTLLVQSSSTYQDQDGEEVTAADFEEEISVLVTGFETEDGVELSTLRSLASLSDMNE